MAGCGGQGRGVVAMALVITFVVVARLWLWGGRAAQSEAQ
jgi:hypothetical protein